MAFDASTIAHYLIERGCIDAESVLDEDFVAVDRASRNRNIKVTRRDGSGWFLKQPSDRDPGSVGTLAREAACYALAEEDERFASLRALMPRRRFSDPRRQILAIELVAPAESVFEHHRRVRQFPPAIGAALGEALGSYHRGVTDGGSERLAGLHLFPRQAPWVLSLHESVARAPVPAGGAARLSEIVRRFEAFPRALRGLLEGWTHDALIHGDMKWENCLLQADGPDGAPRIRIVDWELADLGDALWDAGSIVQAYLSFWVLTLELQAGVPASRSAAGGAVMGESMRPALRAFWLAYRRARGLSGSAERAALQRCLAYAGARLIQTAFEMVHTAADVSPHALCQLQMSMNILADPARAVEQFIGPVAPTPAEATA